MIIFLLISFLIFVYYRRSNDILRFLAIFYFIGIVVFLLRSFEVAAGSLDWFVSDEYYYAEAAKSSLHEITFQSRAVWLWLNNLLINYDLMGEIGIKLINIPIVALLLIVIAKRFALENKLIWIAFLTPYIFIMTNYNLRDPLALLVSIFLMRELAANSRGWILRTLLLSIALFGLRAEMLFIIFALSLLANSIWSMRGSRRAFSSGMLLIIFVVAVFGFIGGYLNEFIDSRVYWLEYRFIENIEDTLDGRNAVLQTGNLGHDLVAGIMRYIFTPVPTSIISAYVSGELVFTYGVVESIVRLANQVLFYGIGFYILTRPRRFFSILWGLHREQKLVLALLLAHSLIYGIYLLGSGHQRLKMPFQLGVVVISLTVYSQRKGANMLACEQVRGAPGRGGKFGDGGIVLGCTPENNKPT